MKKTFISILLTIIICLTPINVFSGCKNKETIKLYNIASNTIETINIEDYVAGIVAGEINNDWPIEAIKAQCIVARTFTYNFLTNRKSKYKNADISNDISEAQTYNKGLINDKIKQAVKKTEDLVLKSNNELIEPYFHSNSGGITELASTGFNYTEINPYYLKSIISPENKTNSENFSWSYTFKKSEILSALNSIGIQLNNISTIDIIDKSNTGRAITIKIGDKSVDANTFRLSLGNSKLKSTLIKNIKIDSETITFSGLGYGHGVGMSQWGAKILADSNNDYSYILNYYYNDISIVKI